MDLKSYAFCKFSLFIACSCPLCPVFSFGSNRKFGHILNYLKFYVTAVTHGRLMFSLSTMFINNIQHHQTRRHGGAYRGRAPPNDCLCPPNENCAPPSEDCAPKKLAGSGLLECKLRLKLVFATSIFVIFVD